ncbi:MAG TPA: glycosyltransferase family 2 protein, partial [Chitinophagaceae bacterium]|nr:glycosyltransferase family 2 protein [Chitinophagaceae bacterium]
KFIFWISFALIFYSYIGYGILLFVLVAIKKLFRRNKAHPANTYEPFVTLVVAAYNEEDFILEKIHNTMNLDYPTDKLQVIFISDGSNDKTPDLIRNNSSFELLHQPERRGKVAAMNRAYQFVKAPIIIFCDANTLLNKECIREIASHYENEKVGAVAGEKKIMVSKDGMAASAGEGLYWKYESFLKKLDSELYSVMGAAGELFSVRTSLFEKAGEDVIIEDFVQSMKVCQNGYVVRYEPKAYAMESGSLSMKEEQKRKIRISAGAFQAMVILKDLFNVFKYPVIAFQFISHRILRWTLCPLAIVTLFISNIILVAMNAGPIYFVFLFLQFLFYGLAIVGWIFANRNIKIKVLYIPYYFLFMNVSVYFGFARFVKKNQSVLWEKAARQKAA